MTIPSLRQSFRIACRKPGTLEAWVFRHVPKLLDELERLRKKKELSKHRS
jgi:hypothetical protein